MERLKVIGVCVLAVWSKDRYRGLGQLVEESHVVSLVSPVGCTEDIRH